MLITCSHLPQSLSFCEATRPCYLKQCNKQDNVTKQPKLGFITVTTAISDSVTLVFIRLNLVYYGDRTPRFSTARTASDSIRTSSEYYNQEVQKTISVSFTLYWKRAAWLDIVRRSKWQVLCTHEYLFRQSFGKRSCMFILCSTSFHLYANPHAFAPVVKRVRQE
jgi:hypothetical protein